MESQYKLKYIYIVLSVLIFTSSYGQKERGLIREGNGDYKKRNFSEAETKYRKSLEANPYSYPGNYNLGNALYKQDKAEEAVKFYSGSTSIGKDKKTQADAFYNLGNSYMKTEKYQESINAYKQALKLNENDEDARYNLSYALSKLKQQQQQQQQDQKQDKNKDQQKKDQQQQQKDQKKQEQQEQQAKQQRQPKISKEDAERMLQALKNEEKNLQKKLAKRFDATMGNAEKDW